ncbi:MAG: hypothetical protein ACOCUF_01960 [Patescibacteria group bacterium]
MARILGGIFLKKNYFPVDCVRKKIWNNSKVSFVYAQNIILFVSKDFIENNPAIKKAYEENKNNPLSLVHPELYLLKSKICHPIFKLFPQSAPRFIKRGIYRIFKMEKD